jgi:hypothetical protein
MMLPTPWFVGFGCSNHNYGVVESGWHSIDKALCARGWSAANWANSSEFFDVFGSS